MAFLYFPFYAVGYFWHYLVYGNGGTGMEVEYRTAMAFFGIFCLLLTLLMLRKILRRYFSEPVVGITLLVLVFGTNLLYYTTYEGCMAHVSNLLLFTLFLLMTERWYSEPDLINSGLLGLLMGLITLIRPTNILIAIPFILYNITSFNQLQQRIILFLKKWPLLLVFSIAAVLVWIPQMIYWHQMTGQYLFFSYVGERFYFSHPRIYSGFFSFRKGWLIYTPLGSLMLTGFIFMYKRLQNIFWPYLIFYIAIVYVTFSWWSWWYGGSFSCRPMVETYAVLVFPLACSFDYFIKRLTHQWNALLSAVIITLIALNIFQTYQYSHQIIHWDRMSYEAYKNVFLSMQNAPDSLLAPPPGTVENRESVK